MIIINFLKKHIKFLSSLKKMKPIDSMLLFGILGTICTAIAIFYTWRQNKLSSEKSTQTLTNTTELLQENKNLKEQVENQSNKIDQLRRENNKLSSKLMDKSLDIYNNLTGNEEKPIIVVNSTKVIVSPDKSIPRYFMIQFSIENKGKFPMRNMRIRINDIWGREMILYGVKHFVDGASIGFGVRDKESEYKNFESNPSFDIGTLSPNVSTLLYRTTFSPESMLQVNYNVELIWDGGYLYHFITFKTEGERLLFEHWEALFNGKPFSDMSCVKFDLQ
jgi:hypothetical protein